MSLRIVCDGCEHASIQPDQMKHAGWTFARLNLRGPAAAHLCPACFGLALRWLKTQGRAKS